MLVASGCPGGATVTANEVALAAVTRAIIELGAVTQVTNRHVTGPVAVELHRAYVALTTEPVDNPVEAT